MSLLIPCLPPPPSLLHFLSHRLPSLPNKRSICLTSSYGCCYPTSIVRFLGDLRLPWADRVVPVRKGWVGVGRARKQTGLTETPRGTPGGRRSRTPLPLLLSLLITPPSPPSLPLLSPNPTLCSPSRSIHPLRSTSALLSPWRPPPLVHLSFHSIRPTQQQGGSKTR